MTQAMIGLRICIDVDDLDRGIAFFTDGLGLSLVRRLSEDMAEMSGAPMPIDLLANPAGSLPAAGASRDYGRHWTPVHLDLVVQDLDAAVERAGAAGAVLERPIVDRAWGRMANLADPFGNGFCLLQMSERGYDAMIDGGDGGS